MGGFDTFFWSNLTLETWFSRVPKKRKNGKFYGTKKTTVWSIIRKKNEKNLSFVKIQEKTLFESNQSNLCSHWTIWLRNRREAFSQQKKIQNFRRVTKIYSGTRNAMHYYVCKFWTEIATERDIKTRFCFNFRPFWSNLVPFPPY